MSQIIWACEFSEERFLEPGYLSFRGNHCSSYRVDFYSITYFHLKTKKRFWNPSINDRSFLYHQQVELDRIWLRLSKEKWPLERSSNSLLPLISCATFIFLSSAKCRIWEGNGAFISSKIKQNVSLVNGKVNFTTLYLSSICEIPRHWFVAYYAIMKFMFISIN